MHNERYCPSHQTYKPTHLEYICQIVEQQTLAKWLTQGPKHPKDNQSHSLW